MKTYIVKTNHISRTPLFITVGSNKTYMFCRIRNYSIISLQEKKKEKEKEEYVKPACKEQIAV